LKSLNLIGRKLNDKREAAGQLLLYTWKDLFVLRLEDILVTDLIDHRIPIDPDSQPICGKDKLYTMEESDWIEEHLPEMLKAGIIGRSESP